MKQLNTTQINFYKSSKAPDYLAYFPTNTNQIIGIEYYEAIKPVSFVREHVKGEFVIQFLFNSVEEVNNTIFYVFKNHKFDGTMTYTNVNGFNYKLTYVFDEGIYQIKVNDCISDYIVVDNKNKNLVKIKAWGDGINFDTAFYNSEHLIYTCEAFYSGYVEFKPGTSYIDQFKGDPNTIINVEIEPSMDMVVMLTDIHQNYLQKILYLFSLNNIEINNKIVVLKSEVKTTRKENTDLYDVSAEFQLNTEYSYD